MFICVLGTGAQGQVGMGAAEVTSMRRGWDCPMTNTVHPKQRLPCEPGEVLVEQVLPCKPWRDHGAADIHTAAPGRHVSKEL